MCKLLELATVGLIDVRDTSHYSAQESFKSVT